uniref:PDZ domain-containing protein n=1 Tax=Ciona intestinalis TaxID=7719 RepID=F6W610_CIOIN
MEVQKGSINDRLGASRKERKEHHREQRLSKAIIGGPIQLKEKSSESHDTNDVTGGPSLVMKCVIVQRDERGYGLTVSGDNPVYVQSVKEDGAAHKAGVVQGDRIIKVNGSKVTECNHVEVVKLIKADSYVALTLLGAPVTHNNNLASGDSPIHTEVQAKPKQSTGKTTFYDEKVETI